MKATLSALSALNVIRLPVRLIIAVALLTLSITLAAQFGIGQAIASSAPFAAFANLFGSAGTAANNEAAPPVLSPPANATRFDFDGDGKADIAVWRPSTATWHVKSSFNNTMMTPQQQGILTDKIVPADYNGDHITDYAVWTPSNGNWNIIKSGGGGTVIQQFGQTGDVPVPGDFDGDGKDDIAVWRPSNGVWYILKSSDGVLIFPQLGSPADIPVQEDYDGDGVMDIAVWVPSTGYWYYVSSSDGSPGLSQWGQMGDIPVPANYNDNMRSDFAVWRPSVGIWYVKMNEPGGAMIGNQFGNPSPNADVLAPANYNKVIDPAAEATVWRPSTGIWHLLNMDTQNYTSDSLGVMCDVPAAAAYIFQTIPCTPPTPTPNSPTPTPTPTPTVTPTATPTPPPTPSGTPQLSKEYIYSGSRILAVEDANAQP